MSESSFHLEQWLQRVQSHDGLALNVRVKMDVVGVNVMLNDMLVNPGRDAAPVPAKIGCLTRPVCC